MYLWNIKEADLQSLVGMSGPELRKKLRLARYDGKKLEYLQPVRVRTGWLTDQYIIDARATNRVYGASDPLHLVPEQVIILLRESPAK